VSGFSRTVTVRLNGRTHLIEGGRRLRAKGASASLSEARWYHERAEAGGFPPALAGNPASFGDSLEHQKRQPSHVARLKGSRSSQQRFCSQL